MGIQKQRVHWRQLAMALIALTLIKFYVLDVWSMNEGGKIVSFVVLGILILTISFLMNRIKEILVEKDSDRIK